MPSRRLLLTLSLITLLGIAGVVVEGLARWALALDGLLLVAFAIDLARARRIEVEATREWPQLLMQGAAATLRVSLVSSSARRLVVRLRETLHPGLASSPRREEIVLEPRGRAAWRVDMVPRRRGEHEAGPLVGRLLGPWGLAWSQRLLLDGERRRIYPQVRWDGKVGHLLLLAHRRALGGNPQKLQGLGREPYGLREYLAGDPVSKIHWKASARHRRLVTREETWERGARLLILLDCGRGMSGRDGERSKLDHALAAALALTRVAAARGDRVTLMAFSDRIERTVRVHGAERDVSKAYGRLYDLEARLAEPAFDLAADTAVGLESRRSTAVLFTSVVDLAAAELLQQSLLSLERRHRPILLNLEDPELRDLAHQPPESADAAFAQISALEILLMNRRLGTRLRHAGVRVVSTPADRLALEALESYLALFR